MLILCIIIWTLIGLSCLDEKNNIVGLLLVAPAAIILLGLALAAFYGLIMALPIIILLCVLFFGGRHLYKNRAKYIEIGKNITRSIFSFIKERKITTIIVCILVVFFVSIFILEDWQHQTFDKIISSISGDDWEQANLLLEELPTWSRYRDKVQSLQDVIDLIFAGDYEAANTLLLNMPSSESPYYELRSYTQARLVYDPNDLEKIESAQRKLKHVYIRLLSDDIFAFEKELQESYDAYKRNYYKGKIPYKGMPIDDIIYTDWGKPFDITTESDIGGISLFYKFNVNGELHRVHTFRRHNESESDAIIIWVS